MEQLKNETNVSADDEPPTIKVRNRWLRSPWLW
jgi:hypothetical protein